MFVIVLGMGDFGGLTLTVVDDGLDFDGVGAGPVLGGLVDAWRDVEEIMRYGERVARGGILI